jgi:DnaJ-class molecular chaperone
MTETPAFGTVKCSTCKGTGLAKHWDGPCERCEGTGMLTPEQQRKESDAKVLPDKARSQE